MSVQAFDSLRTARDTAPVLSSGKQTPPLRGVFLMGSAERRAKVWVDFGLLRQALDPPFGLQSRDRGDGLTAGEPVQRWERVSIQVGGPVSDDQRMAGGAASNDGERDEAVASQLLCDSVAVRKTGYLRVPVSPVCAADVRH